jgi:hypothetical protein
MKSSMSGLLVSLNGIPTFPGSWQIIRQDCNTATIPLQMTLVPTRTQQKRDHIHPDDVKDWRPAISFFYASREVVL